MSPVFAVISGPKAFVLLIVAVLPAWLFWRIAAKAGYPGILGALMILPFLNILLIILAVFLEWPVEAEVKRLRAKQSTSQTG